MKRYVITGGAGFIGSNIAATLLRQPNTDVVIVDDFSSGDWRNLIPLDCEVRAADCDDPRLLAEIAAGEYHGVFHEAAITDTTVMDQRRMVEVNTNAFKSLLEATASSSTRLVYASSAGTYGNSPAPNAIGRGELPENIYGFSKLAMDRIAARFYARHNGGIVGLRYFNVYGPGEHHKHERSGNNTASMMLQLYMKAKAGEQLRLFKYGEQQRDFVYIRDVIDANLEAMNGTLSGVCNVGSGQARCFNDAVAILGDTLNQSFDVEYFDNPFSFYQMHTEADLTETQRILDWLPTCTLEIGMRDYIQRLELGQRGPLDGIHD